MSKRNGKILQTCKICSSTHIPYKRYNEYCYKHIPLDKRCNIIIPNKGQCKNPAMPGLTRCKSHRKSILVTQKPYVRPTKNSDVTKAEYIYIVWLGKEHYYKIGKTVNMTKRLESLRSSNPWIEERFCELVKTSGKVEARLHKMFKRQRIEREVFYLSDQDLETAHSYMLQFIA